jgi:hypothetical protein
MMAQRGLTREYTYVYYFKAKHLDHRLPLAYHLAIGIDGMAYFEFVWIDSVVEKLLEREISTEDIEGIVNAPTGQDLSRSTGLPVAFGHLADGRFVIVVYRWLDPFTVQPITAYEVPE